jgi:predicted ABC-type transport system involved in lysophospholipase L1 biosynthesis ATPase subunit
MGDRNFLKFFAPHRLGEGEPADVEFGVVKVRPGHRVEDVQRALQQALVAGIAVRTKAELLALEMAFQNSVSPVGPIFMLGTAIGFIVGMMISYQILYTDLSDQLSQYATLKAMCFENGYLVRVVLQQASFCGLIGFCRPGRWVSCSTISSGDRASAAAHDRRHRDQCACSHPRHVRALRHLGHAARARRRSCGSVLMTDLGALGPRATIRVEKVNHFFGEGESRNQVLFDNDIEIDAGQLVIMTGPSGSGKTTLLTLIGALRAVQSGRIEILGHDLFGLLGSPLVAMRRNIGFIFQMHNLFDSLSALENVKMAMQLGGCPTSGCVDVARKSLSGLASVIASTISPRRSRAASASVAVARAGKPPS